MESFRTILQAASLKSFKTPSESSSLQYFAIYFCRSKSSVFSIHFNILMVCRSKIDSVKYLFQTALGFSSCLKLFSNRI